MRRATLAATRTASVSSGLVATAEVHGGEHSALQWLSSTFLAFIKVCRHRPKRSHANPDTTTAWYADRNGEMFDLGGNVVGHCTVNLETDKQCDVTAGVVRYQTLLECTQNA